MAKQPSATGVRRVADLKIDTNRIDLPAGLRLEALIDKEGNIPAENLAEVTQIAALAVEGGVEGVPYTEKVALIKRVFSALTEARDPKSTPPDGG
ncbi:MAG TPA: hypothetical protein PL074_00250 [Thermoflexales bacterium]|nr:hypothetical protein [Thermoflexales bacterium]HQX74707.1 hypothetical protein [Thermoflexales bacterium]